MDRPLDLAAARQAHMQLTAITAASPARAAPHKSATARAVVRDIDQAERLQRQLEDLLAVLGDNACDSPALHSVLIARSSSLHAPASRAARRTLPAPRCTPTRAVP